MATNEAAALLQKVQECVTTTKRIASPKLAPPTHWQHLKAHIQHPHTIVSTWWGCSAIVFILTFILLITFKPKFVLKKDQHKSVSWVMCFIFSAVFAAICALICIYLP